MLELSHTKFLALCTRFALPAPILGLWFRIQGLSVYSAITDLQA